LKFYCENDSQYICIDCITKHTGHRFFKQEQSIALVKKKLAQRLGTLKEELQKVRSVRQKYDNTQASLGVKYEQAVSSAEKVFLKLRKDL